MNHKLLDHAFGMDLKSAALPDPRTCAEGTGPKLKRVLLSQKFLVTLTNQTPFSFTYRKIML
jgi:hypothetical protein